MVMHKTNARKTCSIARGKPDARSQIILNRKEPTPPPYWTSFPKGKQVRPAILKHCIPTGIPIMEIHQRHPTKNQLNALNAPPKINHNRFQRHPIKCPPKT